MQIKKIDVDIFNMYRAFITNYELQFRISKIMDVNEPFSIVAYLLPFYPSGKYDRK